MTPLKRLFDLALSLMLIVVFSPLILLTIAVLAVTDGWPYFYISERMKTPDIAFKLIKFRTMRSDTNDNRLGVSGGDKTNRVTKIGRILRLTKLDELPQLLNIIKGDMSLVGPRPPLRNYVEMFPATYAKVLKNRPGITGLATLTLYQYEEWVLSDCATSEETDVLYKRRCIPLKARLDLIYQRNQTLRFDLSLMMRTLAKILH